MRFPRICFVRYCEEWSDVGMGAYNVHCEEWSDVGMGAYNVITRSDSDVVISCRPV